jgi:beta-galactosidase
MAEITRRTILHAPALAAAGAGLPALAVAAPGSPVDDLAPRQRLLMDFGWRFQFGHARDPQRDFGFGSDATTFAKASAVGAAPAQLSFDETGWRALDLPHDWVVELPFAPTEDPPPAPKDPAEKPKDDPRAAHGFKPIGRAYPETSVGWYRRVFELPAEDRGRRISLEFDGVFRNSLVMLNGYVVGRNESGYAPFRVDITDFAEYGGKNVLAIRVDASLGEGWFYEGAGIYRHVWLVKTAPLHVAQWGVAVRASPQARGASLSIGTEVVNDGDTDLKCEVVSTIVDPSGKPAGVVNTPLEVGPGRTATLEQAATLAEAQLWSLKAPKLYRLITELRVAGAVVDRYVTPFGVRWIRFDPEQGFFLNGEHVVLKGTCNHQDHAGVGTALPDRLHELRIEKLIEMGSNAYRTAHNPHAPELMDACDRLGMLVVDETRLMSSSAEGLSQLERLVRRDRNRPSVILWSIGNEEPHQGTERGARIAASMKRLVNALDGTRPVAEALDGAYGDGVTKVVDVMGFNYRQEKIDDFHTRFPTKPIVGTETGSTVSTRGIYARDDVRGYLPAYDTEAPWWATTAEAWWTFFDARPFVSGGFVWTGFDYRGEPTPFNRWPNVSSQFGAMDACGFPKDNYFYYQAWWRSEPVLHLFPHWNWSGREGQPVDVWCHTNLDRVELLLNGRSQGVQTVARGRHVAWKVPYAPGVITARGWRGERKVAEVSRVTSGAPERLALRSDRNVLSADGRDVASLTVEVLDARGVVVPDAANLVRFFVEGPGGLIGVGNGDPASHEPDKADQRRAFNGLCLALVQSRREPGRLLVTAVSDGLKSAAVEIRSIPGGGYPILA